MSYLLRLGNGRYGGAMITKRLGALAAAAAIACGPSAPPAAPPAPPPSPPHEEHHPLVHRFEHADEWAAQFDDPARDAWQRPGDVVAAMQIAPGMTVADIGAGTGYFSAREARAAAEHDRGASRAG